jgi:Domain of unknown function (DU1801)
MLDIIAFNNKQSEEYKKICELLYNTINSQLPKAESKIWYAAPVWFRDGNPIVGYWIRKSGVALLFWSGQAFDEPGLSAEGKFKAAQKVYKTVADVDLVELKRWLKISWKTMYDYKNIVKNKGELGVIIKL